MRRSAILALAVHQAIALPATAETALPPAAFDGYTSGKTLTYALNGQVYGAEQYLPGRKVRWAFLNGECLDGEWYPAGDLVCFTYENAPEPQCWAFYSLGGRLMARFMNDPEATTLYELEQSPAPLACEGVEPGV
ncbi:hypothetical protein PSA7680_01181 [Pseudoruegeria aquimaris]|uniref:Uncharacterized protein n=1 Tax=Pseudoruegeria aquimaris TaxID=393663 RepID=A0A1Y5RY14_9RHOB|nr:hypothetical protein [Pseudoruegeria aquimaris]SLN26775.1 hypothetical protein PSA7680_01181 [Pseudoruegeria aquimaris]